MLDKDKYIITKSFHGNRRLTEIIGNMILSTAKNVNHIQILQERLIYKH